MYHYEECGLPNVWLVNGYTEHETRYGKATSIENTNGLHQCIAQEIIKSRPQLTGNEFRFLRHELDMSQKQLASVFGKSEQTVANWEKGEKDVPKYADLIIRTLYKENQKESSSISKLIEYLNKMEQKDAKDQLRFEDTNHRWRAAS